MFLNILWIIFWGGFVQMAIILALLGAISRRQPKEQNALSQLIRTLTVIKDASLHITLFYLVFFLLILPLLFVGIGGLIFVLYQFQLIPSSLMQEATWDGLFNFAFRLVHSQWENLLYLPLCLIILKQAVKWWKNTLGETVSSAGITRTQHYPKSVGIICAVLGIMLFLVLQFIGSWNAVDLPEAEASEAAIQTRNLFLGQK